MPRNRDIFEAAVNKTRVEATLVPKLTNPGIYLLVTKMHKTLFLSRPI